MAENTKIQWATHTWSPWRGCSKVSPGCAHCYAEALSRRNPAVLGVWGPNGTRVINKDWGKPLRWDRAAAKAGERHRVFPSLCDPFEDRPELVEPRDRLWSLIRKTPNLDWLILTKRPERWRRCWPLDPIPGHVRQNEGDGKDWRKIPNVWMGTSVEDQQRADERIPELLKIPAAVRWLSVEPLLGPVDLSRHLGYWIKRPCIDHQERFYLECPRCNGKNSERVNLIDWVVVGGESGPDARPCDLRWIRAIVEQCKAAQVPVFCKQLGAVAYGKWDIAEPNDIESYGRRVLKDPKGGNIEEFPDDLRVREMPRIEA